MTLKPNFNISDLRANNLLLAASVIAAVVSASCLLGWAFHIDVLRTVLPGFPQMKPNTAIAFLFAAFALFATSRKEQYPAWRYAAVAGGLIASSIGALTLIEYVGGVDLYLDRLLLPAYELTSGPLPGRMSPHSAVNFVILGLSLSTLCGGRAVKRVSEVLALLLSVTTLVSVIGFIYSAQILYGLPNYVGMALHTASLFLVFSAALLAANPDSETGKLVTTDTLGGVAARRLIPAVVLVPLLIDWLRLMGQEHHFFDENLGSAMLQVTRILVMCGIILYFSRKALEMDLRRREFERQAAANEKRYHDLFEFSQGMICTHDVNGVLKDVNPAVTRALGYSRDEIIGHNLIEFIPAERVAATGDFFNRMKADGYADGLLPVITRSGEHAMWRYHSVLYTEDGDEPYVIGHAQDVTELITAQEKLKNLSLTDDLTGLLNRRGFLTMAEQQVKLERHRRTSLGLTLMFADIDGLKAINDIYGHEAGSDAIVALGTAIKGSLRSADLIARWGGDEFVMLTIGAEDEDASTIFDRIQSKLDEYNAVSGKPYKLACSIGLAGLPLDDERGLEFVLAEADKAMYKEKRRRKLDRGSSETPSFQHRITANSQTAAVTL